MNRHGQAGFIIPPMLLLLVLQSVHLARAQTENPPTRRFSRTAWIIQHMRDVRISGGVIGVLRRPPGTRFPADEERVDGPPSLKPRSIVRADIGTTTPVQVSEDLLPTDVLAQAATHAEPYLDANPSNPSNLSGGWQENRFPDNIAGARALSYGTSFDLGQTWTANLIPGLTKIDGGVWDRASDPWVAFGPNNQVYFSSLVFDEGAPDNGIDVSVSTDGGMTWSGPVEAFHTAVNFSDKDAVTVDTFPASPHFGNVYVSWDLNIGTKNKQWVMVARSTDGGATYGTPVRVQKKGPSNIGAIPRVGPDGTVYLVWMGTGGHCGNVFLMSDSTDGGQTWTRSRLIGDDCPAGERKLRTGDGLPSFAIDPESGFLYVAWQDGSLAGTGQAALIVSKDKGATWSAPARVSDGPVDAPAFTIAVAVSPGGQVAVSYYSLRNDPQRRFLADEYVSVSMDGGETFLPAVRATPTSFDVRLAAHADGGLFLGDYQGLVESAGKFHLLWVNTGIPSLITGSPEPEVLFSSTR
ncbi:MAG TPA: sialidase family protein [Blastocatellia bacterium]|nr:sialidase family protein [Blastocatellia bacterium]